ncbi:Chromatin modification- protein meaf6 [Microbotryomycetes sp. JL201]|nr:Chromatin modification- protein meaf6 [Microbotryomycetes sp. JL201]
MSTAAASKEAKDDKSTSKDAATGGSSKTGASAGGAAAGATTNGEKTAADGANGQQKDKGGQVPVKPASPLDQLSPAEARKKLDESRKELRTFLERKKKVDQELATLEASIYAFEGSYLADQLFPAQASNGPAQFGNIIKGYDSYVKATSSNADRKRGRGMDEPRTSDRMFSMSSSTYQKVVDVRPSEALADSSDDETSSSTGRKKRRN